MAKDVRDGGANSRPLDDTIAQTGPGIADDPLGPGEALPEPIDEAQVERVKEKLEHLGEP
jgi:hypothetical protein